MTSAPKIGMDRPMLPWMGLKQRTSCQKGAGGDLTLGEQQLLPCVRKPLQFTYEKKKTQLSLGLKILETTMNEAL